MRIVPSLAWRLLRGSGGRGALTTALSAFAVAIATALLLLTLGVALGFNQRGERDAWLFPQKSEANATAVMAVSTDVVRGQPLVVVDLAALSDDAPAPPGLNHFPAPGEVWTSPALAQMIADLPDNELRQRFDNQPAGTHIAGNLTRQATVHPEQLMAVIGREPEYLEESAPVDLWIEQYYSPPVPIADFSGHTPIWLPGYQSLSAFAAGLVVVPLFVLGTAAGRLATAHRDRRLSAMRLVGATPGQVLGITVFETALTGLAGAIAGIGAYVLALPLASKVEATGGTWYVSDLWVGWEIAVATLLLVPLVVGLSALLGLRNLVISPLGVARRQQGRGASFWRGVIFIALLVAYWVLAPGVRFDGTIMFAVFFGFVFLAFSLVGPFVVRLLGYLLTFLARTPQTLLAGRRIVDDPYSVWRIVGGITLTGFVAGFLTVIIPHPNLDFDRTQANFALVADSERSVEIVSEIRDYLDQEGINATVYAEDMDEESAEQSAWISVQVDGGPANVDRVRTIVWSVPGLSMASTSDRAAATVDVHLTDVRTASVLVLTVTLAVASASAMITGVTGVLDRRQTFSALRLAGTPLNVLDGARLRETLIPFVLLGGGAIATGIFCALPLAVIAGTGSEERSITLLLIPLAVAVTGLLLAEIASRVTLRSATADPTAHRL